MKESELMIYDIVRCSRCYRLNGGAPYYCRVLTIGRTRVEVLYIDGGYTERELEEISPIPITDEILKANGFEYDYDAPNLTHDYYSIKLEYGDTFWAKVQYDITNNVVDIKTDSIGGVLSQQLRVICKNVHELQHALRLCGLNDLADNFVIEKGGAV